MIENGWKRNKVRGVQRDTKGRGAKRKWEGREIFFELLLF